MTPTLPQDASDLASRRAALDHARELYRYSYTYPPGAAWADELPRGEGYPIPYLADYVKLEATLKANQVAARMRNPEELTPAQQAQEQSELKPEDLARHLFDLGQRLRAGVARTRFGSVDEFARFFGVIEQPAMMKLFRGSAREQDELFAWQRVAGANPMVLSGIDAVPDNFPVTEAHYRVALGDDDSLAAARAEGRLFLADHRRLDGLASGRNGETRKYLYAPMALFARPRDGRAALLPVAIQCGQTPGEEYPVFTPVDGVRWRMARTIVQIADGNDHETRQHLGKTHAVMEAVVLAATRNIPEQHPLSALLTPHFETTLAINNSAKHSLVAPDGGVDHILGGALESSLKLTALGLGEFRLDEAAVPAQLAARRVTDRDALPVFPYRDDALDVWGAIAKFVGDYVALYYRDDAAVVADTELAAFFQELAADEGGRLRGVPRVSTRALLSELLASIVFTASAQHSALNYAQFPFMGMIPNLPGAGYAPAPRAATPDVEQSLLDLLPPSDIAVEHFTLAYQLSAIRRNRLGQYPPLHWRHGPARELAAGFARQLEDVELLIGARDGTRLLSYPYLKPSQLAASVHI